MSRGMWGLASFNSVFKVRHQDIEVSIDADPETGVADSGDVDIDLANLLLTLGKAADEKSTALVLFIDACQNSNSSR